jgi:hypothetical protein
MEPNCDAFLQRSEWRLSEPPNSSPNVGLWRLSAFRSTPIRPFWQLLAAALAAEQARQGAKAQIMDRQASQHRVVREALLGLPAALERLQALDTQIAALRPALAL